MQAQAWRRYSEGVGSQFNYFATWFPNEARYLGQIGVLHHGVFKHVGSLAEEDIRFSVRRGAAADFEHSGCIRILGGAGGRLGPPLVGEQRITVEFDSAGGYVFSAMGCTVSTIEDRRSVESQIKVLAMSGIWERDWVLVDTLVAAASCTVIVAGDQQASFSVLTTGLSGNALRGLGCAEARARVSMGNGSLTSFVGEANLTPLFGLSRLRSSFWSDRQRLSPIKSAADKLFQMPDPPALEVVAPPGAE